MLPWLMFSLINNLTTQLNTNYFSHVDACSICGTDLRIAVGTHRAYENDLRGVPGHEVAGTVVETGDGAAIAVGEAVFVAPNYGCGRCRSCRRGQVNLCDGPRAVGITEDGGFAEYLLLPGELVDQGNVLGFAKGIDPAAVALAEPLACALRGLTCVPNLAPGM